MSAVGGPIIGLNLNGRPFSVAEDAESNRKIGGSENEIQLNGDKTARLIKTLVAWMADGLTVSCDDDNEDHEFIQSLADLNSFFPITAEYASGAIWQGDGQITGEIAYSSKNSTIPLTLSGTGNFTKQ
jgi:hypothetical protein